MGGVRVPSGTAKEVAGVSRKGEEETVAVVDGVG